MVSLRLIWIGKTQESYLEQGIQTYLKKLKHYIPTEIVILKPADYGTLSVADCQIQETQQILKKLNPSETRVFLDEKGKLCSSRELATLLDKFQHTENQWINWIIGGAFGFAPALIPPKDLKLSLSPMTFTHQMVRLLLLEQLYRGFTILKGLPYHHD